MTTEEPTEARFPAEEHSPTTVIDLYLSALPAVSDLIGAPEVGAAWGRPSALEGMTVGELAVHLARVVTHLESALAIEPSGELLTGAQRVTRAPWATSGPESDINRTIRQLAHDDATAGWAALRHRIDASVDEAPRLLAEWPDGRTVAIPHEGIVQSLDDYLITRLVELAVHCDDLAVSVGLPAPTLAAGVAAAAGHLLLDVSLERHGWVAVIRALARSERAKGSISAFDPA